MGEYVRLRNEQVKIGTCESLYYYTEPQFKKELPLMAQDGGLPPHQYLNPEYGFRFRFPFPDENFQLENYDNFDKGMLLELSRLDFNLDDYDHDRKCISINPHKGKWGGNNTNVFIPCLQDKNFNLQTSVNPSHKSVTFIEIVAQKIMPAKNKKYLKWLVIRCPYCDNIYRLPQDAALQLITAILKRYCNYYERKANIDKVKNYIKVCRIIQQGYID